MVIDFFGDNSTVICGTLPQGMASCLQTMDRFIQQPSHAVLASMVVAGKHKAGISCFSLVNSIANVLGLKDLKNVPEQASLGDMGLDSLMEAEIKETLERNHDVVMSVRSIRRLTFGKLKILGSGGVYETAVKTETTTFEFNENQEYDLRPKTINKSNFF